MSEQKIDEAQVRHVAQLARLEFSDEEVREMGKQLNRILDYMSELNKIDVRDVEPTYHSVPMETPFHKDEVERTLRREEALEAAPESTDSCFAVQKVLELES